MGKLVFAVLAATFSMPAVAVVTGDFTLKRIDAETWQAEYCLDHPVEAIRFERPFAGLRENSWKTRNPGFEFEFREGTAELVRRDGAPFECADIEIAQYTQRPEKNYYAFSMFSDGGASVYTGYLMGPVRLDGEWRETELRANYRGRDGEQVITREPGRLTHQLVYFGRQDVLNAEGVVAVIDPAMPSKARENILETVPAVNDFLAESFGFRPPAPYMIFMATDLDAFDGHSVKGGTQPGQILFTLRGRGVVPMMERNPTHFSKSAAHEVLHLWQTDHWFGKMGEDHAWVHEGSADALAFEIMRLVGIHDERKYRETWKSTEDECIAALAETSIRDAPQAGRFDVVYSCGALVNRLVGEALNSANPGEGIIRFWQAMAARPAEERQGASEELYFRTLEALGFDDEKRGALRAFLELKSGDARQALSDLRDTLC